MQHSPRAFGALLLWSLGGACGKPAEGKGSVLDAVMVTETVFAEADRSRVAQSAQVGPDGVRTYTFALRPEPGMNPARHFYLLTVLAVPRGARSSLGTANTAGPGGAFVEQRTRTGDGAFELVLRLGALLPAEVREPALALDHVARALTDRYATLAGGP